MCYNQTPAKKLQTRRDARFSRDQLESGLIGIPTSMAQKHKNLPLAVHTYYNTYHSSVGCEPSKAFHGRIPYKVLDQKHEIDPRKIFATVICGRMSCRRHKFWLIKRNKLYCNPTCRLKNFTTAMPKLLRHKKKTYTF